MMITHLIDIDGILAQTEGNDYKNSKPRQEVIDRVNQLYDNGDYIKIFTGRGSRSGINWDLLTVTQLKSWGVKYHELLTNKPFADCYVDDKAKSLSDFMLEKKDCTVIIPAYNEEKTVGLVIEAVRRVNNCPILVADNASTDNTSIEVLKYGINPILVPKRGKGYAYQGLFNEVKTEYIVMVDADYTYPIDVYLNEMIGLLRPFDVVICSREWKQAGAMSLTNSFGNWCLSKLASMLYGYKVNDICSGMWGFKKSALEKFNITSGNGVVLECELFAEAIKNKCSIYQLPITYRARVQGTKAKVRILDGIRDALVLIKRSRLIKK